MEEKSVFYGGESADTFLLEFKAPGLSSPLPPNFQRGNTVPLIFCNPHLILNSFFSEEENQEKKSCSVQVGHKVERQSFFKTIPVLPLNLEMVRNGFITMCQLQQPQGWPNLHHLLTVPLGLPPRWGFLEHSVL